MQQLKKLYRSSYSGESVVKNLVYKDVSWTPELESVPNSVFNTHTTTQAAVIGNGESRATMDLNLVVNHVSGIGGVNSLQTYGCNALYREHSPDFLVAVGDEIIEEIAASDYCNNNIVYANADALLDYPGKFYLIPQNLYFDAGSLAVYLACFDGHKRVFMIGYDSYVEESAVNNIYKDTAGYPTSDQTQNGAWFTKSLATVMSTYDDVDFIRVMPTNTYYTPVEFQQLVNFRQIDYRQFAIEADLGGLI